MQLGVKKKNVLLDAKNIVHEEMLYYRNTVECLKRMRTYCDLYAIAHSMETWQKSFPYKALHTLCKDLITEKELGYGREEAEFYKEGIIPLKRAESPIIVVSPDAKVIEAATEAGISTCFLYGRPDEYFRPFEEKEKVPKQYTLKKFSIMDLEQEFKKID